MTRRHIRLVCLIVLLASLCIHAWDLSRPGLVDRTGRLKVPDFLQFYTYGSLIRAGRPSDLYDPRAHAETALRQVDPRLVLSGFHPNYSPAIGLLMSPLTALSFLQAAAAWSVLSLLLYGTAVALVVGTTANVRSDVLTMTLVAASWPAVFVVLRYGQISTLSLAFVAAAVWLHRKGYSIAAGVALGALAYKPNLLIAPVLILLVSREWRLLLGLGLGAGLELGVALAAVGPTTFARYVQVLIAIARQPEVVQMYSTESHSFRGLVRLATTNPALLFVGLSIGVAFATWAGWCVWRRSDDVRLRWSALTLAMLFSSPHLLTYDLLLLAVPLILIADWRCQPDLDRELTYVDSCGGGLSGPRPPPVAGLKPRLHVSGAPSQMNSGRKVRPACGGKLTDLAEEHATAWRVALVLLYIGAWPGTLLARMYGVQPSTIGMGLALWLLATYLRRSGTPTTTVPSSSMSPIISS